MQYLRDKKGQSYELTPFYHDILTEATKNPMEVGQGIRPKRERKAITSKSYVKGSPTNIRCYFCDFGPYDNMSRMRKHFRQVHLVQKI